MVALLLLTALVWWRVLNRSSGATEAKPTHSSCPTPSVAPAAQLPAAKSVTVEVLNSTNRTGIAGKARTALETAGFLVPKPAVNDKKKLFNKIKTVGQIRYSAAQKPAATLLEYYFPGATLVPQTTSSATVVVSLGQAYRGVASAASVAAALKKAHLVSGPPTPAKTC
ncbi:LytR C-terminal domain-containing protein [uncultured Jatrophihabitans sp.]|uniref:LytR C-terminal domain-containing protein n=1 Tax=uncultured Jatrophihabitans sp. TaxID=1610747 RepID=UPI0035CB2815